MFWIYTDDKGNYITDCITRFGRTKTLNKAAVWDNRRNALSWKRKIKNKFPTMELKKATLTIIE